MKIKSFWALPLSPEKNTFYFFKITFEIENEPCSSMTAWLLPPVIAV
jgi:hypothetical protein